MPLNTEYFGVYHMGGIDFITQAFFEDIHWIDAMSMTALEYIIDTFNRAQKKTSTHKQMLVLVIDFRPEFTPTNILKNKTNYSLHEMQSLNKEDCLELIIRISVLLSCFRGLSIS